MTFAYSITDKCLIFLTQEFIRLLYILNVKMKKTITIIVTNGTYVTHIPVFTWMQLQAW